MKLAGIDFSSAPSRRKPIQVAEGQWRDGQLMLIALEALPRLSDFEAWLRRAGPWLAGIDMPLGLPRELVNTLRWPGHDGGVNAWDRLMRFYTATPRETLRQTFKAFCDARPVGHKFAHRAADRPAGSSPSMKWVNPPVAWMLHAGVPCLLAANVDLPGLHAGDTTRRVLEAYPGWLARQVLGAGSYKSDDPARQTPERQQRREQLLQALEAGAHPLGIRLRVPHMLRSALVEEPRGDALDAVLCLVQAAWAAQQGPERRFGWPHEVDPLEGWIAGIPAWGE
jgi:hypothetical protein